MNTIEGKVRSSKVRRMAFALVLVAGFAAQSISLSHGVAVADGGRDHRTVDVTFTKWVVTLPAPTLAGVLMDGVVGGDVGRGRFAGQVLSVDTTSRPGFTLLHPRYEFYGSKHSFIADVRVTENDTTAPATAVIRGVVTSGWMKGARVTGEYTVFGSCPIQTPGNVFGALCFQGTLHLQRGDRHD